MPDPHSRLEGSEISATNLNFEELGQLVALLDRVEEAVWVWAHIAAVKQEHTQS